MVEKQNVSDNCCTPNVYLQVVGLSVQDFRCRVIFTPHPLSQLMTCLELSGKSKICKTNEYIAIVVVLNKDIFKLNISVNYLALM